MSESHDLADYLDLSEGDLIKVKPGYGGNSKWAIIIQIDSYVECDDQGPYIADAERFCYKILWPQFGDESWVAPYEIQSVIRISGL